MAKARMSKAAAVEKVLARHGLTEFVNKYGGAELGAEQRRIFMCAFLQAQSVRLSTTQRGRFLLSSAMIDYLDKEIAAALYGRKYASAGMLEEREQKRHGRRRKEREGYGYEGGRQGSEEA